MKLQGKPKEVVEQLQRMLPVGQYLISFSKHSAPAKLESISVARLADIQNKSDKRATEDGKAKSPAYYLFQFDTFRAVIVLEDFEVIQTIGGVKFVGEHVTLELKEMKE